MSLFKRSKSVLWLPIITAFPIALTSFLWLEVYRGVASRAIDGSGHFAIAQIYSQQIFPDTFGWTNAYFAGISFPNFYPPLFFWLVALLHHTNLLSFATAFKMVATVPLLLIPIAFWAFTWFHGGRNSGKAYGAAIASMLFVTLGEIFQPNAGLDLSSTILDGFYTQPLGLTFLLLWALFYFTNQFRVWRFVLASFLLALTVLANFFNAVCAVLFIAAVLVLDAWNWYRESDPTQMASRRTTLLQHLLSPLFAFLLTAFWTVPMLSAYSYFVTRPLFGPSQTLTRPALWIWYFVAAVGVWIWWKGERGNLFRYLCGCAALLVTLVVAGLLAPRWLPFQVFRFFSTFNLLLSVPVAFGISSVFDWYQSFRLKVFSTTKSKKIVSSAAQAYIVFAITVLMLFFLAGAMSTRKLSRAFAFYTPDNFDRIAPVLQFAKTHKEGRYLVEVLPSVTGRDLVRADSLALNAYLGSQGNEALSIVYREASPNSSFFNAQLNAFSSYVENFGVSSALMDDIDFINQSVERHFKRLRFIGVRYIVVASEEKKKLLENQPALTARHQVGNWTIFDLGEPTSPKIQTLRFRPALFVGEFTLKLRRRDHLDFIRLTEEQFSDAWFEVLLTRSEQSKIDRIEDLNEFGALILSRYQFDDEAKAFAALQNFAQTKPLILLPSQDPLFIRVRSSIENFPKAAVIEAKKETNNDWIDGLEPSYSYNASIIREQWKTIRSILDVNKIEIVGVNPSSAEESERVSIIHNQPASVTRFPIIISMTFHPKWKRIDHQPLYAVTPFFTLTWINKSTAIVFQRTWYDALAATTSLITLTMLLMLVVIDVGRRFIFRSPTRSMGMAREPGEKTEE